MFLPLFSILLSVSPGHGTLQPPKSKPITLQQSTDVPEDTTIGNKDGNDYIVNGMESNKYTLGYQARVKLSDFPNRPTYRFFCGGTVVHQRYVITAAHCLYPDNIRMTPDNVTVNVIVGEHNLCDGVNEGGQALVASEVVVHPNYIHNPSGAHSDIAILKLNKDIIFNNHVWPACLPTSPDRDYSGQSVTVSGWGGTQAWNGDGREPPEQKRQCELKVTTLKVQAYSDIECRDILQQTDISLGMCAYAPNTSVCQGDSGGPLALNRGDRYILLGVTSYAQGCADTRGVANVFVRVQAFLPWIAQNVPEDLQFKKSCESVQ